MAHLGHDHVGEGDESGARIVVAFVLNFCFAILELVGGLWTNSVAVLSDALHDFGDCVALALSWRFVRISKRAGDEVYTFGYRRFSLLGALTMSGVLLAGGTVVLFQSVPRLFAPQAANARGMLLLAGIGIAVNGFSALRMRGGKSLNERVVTWHFIEDVLGWIAVLVVGLVMLFWSVPVLDPVLAILITLFVLWNVGKRVRETFVILLQGVPETLKVAEVEDAIRAIPGICDVHHTHIWSQDGLNHVLTTHAVIANADSYANVATLRRQVKEGLKQFGVLHSTIEFESQAGPACGDVGDGCRCRERE
ncbi:MAG: cation diffusion facilitator family transporter [Candidatus Bipolaricaulota bacterium]|nr:cation diffusion facilitator family transporter [Candidatus Bipolaricaulota bacterium]